LIDALRERESVRAYAISALEAITGEKYGNDAARWRGWAEVNKQA